MKASARLINNSYYLISLRINGLFKIKLNGLVEDKNDLKILEEFNEKFSQRLERILLSVPLRDYSIIEPDYIKSQEMIKHFSLYLNKLKSSGDLKHIWEQLMASIVLVENNKLLFEKLAINPSTKLKWYLYTINILYKDFQKTILKFQIQVPEIYPQMKYRRDKTTEVNFKVKSS